MMPLSSTTRRIPRLVIGSLGCLAGWLNSSFVAWAIVVMGSGDPDHNTTAPTGSLAGSGWQWEGNWGGLTATAIGPHHIITAAHVGGGAGTGFQFQNQWYVAVSSYLLADSDLRICKVAGTLPTFAPVYFGNAERGKGVLLVGAGGPRGDLVTIAAGAGKKLKGWLWSSRDGRIRWGTNTVGLIAGAGGVDASTRAPQPGDLLGCTFDSSAGNEEGTLTDGDSGGGMFLLDGGSWKLAGILRAVEGKFRTSATGGDFSAALFDKGGFYEYNGAAWDLIPSSLSDRPTVLYGNRLSGSATWIQSCLADTATEESRLTVESSAKPDGPFAADSAVTLDLEVGQFVAPIGSEPRYYRIADARYNFTGVALQGDRLLMKLRP